MCMKSKTFRGIREASQRHSAKHVIARPKGMRRTGDRNSRYFTPFLSTSVAVAALALGHVGFARPRSRGFCSSNALIDGRQQARGSCMNERTNERTNKRFILLTRVNEGEGARDKAKNETWEFWDWSSIDMGALRLFLAKRDMGALRLVLAKKRHGSPDTRSSIDMGALKLGQHESSGTRSSKKRHGSPDTRSSKTRHGILRLGLAK